MACRGVYFALEPHEADRLMQAGSDDERLEIVQEEIEERWDRAWLVEVDKAWDAMHRSLTDGRLEYDNGSPPLNLCVLGGRQLYEGDYYIMCLLTPQQVEAVATALPEVSKDRLRTGYERIDRAEYPDYSEDDFEYTWENLCDLPRFFAAAAESGRYVLFTTDQ